jgi:adenine-specific DNA-methyltransferase
MSRLNDLLRELKQREPMLARDLEGEVSALANRRAFGLNFERHVPEAVELPGRKVRKGDKVRILPPRGERSKKSNERLWRVVGANRTSRLAQLEELYPQRITSDTIDQPQKIETTEACSDDLVVVAEFRDPIYPGLVSTGKIERGGDKPFHTVINAENFHALETLLFTHRGRVDAIYIDPPYNTGAKDWKYNNDYVESDDLYRHSKWLAFMERRLIVAKELLNPTDSVLIVTIDEKEYLRLGLLLEQIFPEATVQMVSSVINPKGASRGSGFRRTDEYLYFVMFGMASPARLQLSSDWASSATGSASSNNENEDRESTPEWTSMMRRGSHAARWERPGLFFPIYAATDGSKIVEVGESIPIGSPLPKDKKGLTTIWPRRSDGSDGVWQVGPEELRKRIEQGRVRLGRATSYGFVVNYLPDGAYASVMSDRFEIKGRAADGSLIAVGRRDTRRVAPSQWKIASHNASEHGTALLRSLLPSRSFPFPKSLYAVEDTLRFFVANKTNAVVLDFFSGSGTTAHAVMRLNKQDGGRRQCICITNNEVGADEQKGLRDKNLRPGDDEWEKWGICNYITKPRVESAITGRTPEGKKIVGDYRFTDEFPISDGFEENAEFFNLTYEAPLRVASNREFKKIAPLLWLRAGALGRRIEDIEDGWQVADAYGVLVNFDDTELFLKEVKKSKQVKIAYLVTDEDRLFETVSRKLPDSVEPVRLYESYLRNFEIESGRGSL